MTVQPGTSSIRIGRKKFVYPLEYWTCGTEGHALQDEKQVNEALKKIAALKTAAQKFNYANQ